MYTIAFFTCMLCMNLELQVSIPPQVTYVIPLADMLYIMLADNGHRFGHQSGIYIYESSAQNPAAILNVFAFHVAVYFVFSGINIHSKY